MPPLQGMAWDFKDRMQSVDKGGGCKVYYTYDISGQRMRKVRELNGIVYDERIYVGGFEIYRKYNSAGVKLERETLHLADGKRRIVLVETRTIDTQNADKAPRQMIRFQLGNHLDFSLP